MAVTMITVMTMMTMMTLDGKSDDYDEKLFGGEKKHTPSANLFIFGFVAKFTEQILEVKHIQAKLIPLSVFGASISLNLHIFV